MNSYSVKFMVKTLVGGGAYYEYASDEVYFETEKEARDFIEILKNKYNKISYIYLTISEKVI